MLRLFLFSSLCAFFMACSSSDDEAVALNQWFIDQGLATSYGRKYKEIEVSIDSFSIGFSNSAYAIGSYAVLGDANGVEHMLYFDMDSLPFLRTWTFRPDSVFYSDIYGGNIPEAQQLLFAEIYWRLEENDLHDTAWLKFDERAWQGFEEVLVENFSIALPEGLPNSKLLIGIKLKSNSNTVLRIAEKSIYDISGLSRIAQRTNITDNCEQCLHAGVRESLFVSIGDVNIDKTVVFAQLVLPKNSMNDHEFAYPFALPLPVYVYGKNENGKYDLETYRVDTAYVNANGMHPNLVFWEGDSLRLQVTNSLRRGNFDFSLRLGTPMLIPNSLAFYNSIYSPEKVFSERPAYARYDFSALEKGKKVKLKLWLAD